MWDKWIVRILAGWFIVGGALALLAPESIGRFGPLVRQQSPLHALRWDVRHSFGYLVGPKAVSRESIEKGPLPICCGLRISTTICCAYR